MDDTAQGARPEEMADGRLNEVITQLCDSKAEEFAMLGYDSVTGEDIWECVSEPYRKGLPALHQLVSDILTLKTTEYMNWMTMNVIYKDSR